MNIFAPQKDDTKKIFLITGTVQPYVTVQYYCDTVQYVVIVINKNYYEQNFEKSFFTSELLFFECQRITIRHVGKVTYKL